MIYDKSVWTDEKPDPCKWYWFDEEPEVGSAPILDCRANMPSKDYVRSVHAIPSAEEIAALVECERALRNLFDEDGNPPVPNTSRAVAMYTDAAAALARLDGARKERGA